MKIYTQDRQNIVTMPRELWVTSCGERWAIIGSFYINPIIGIYETEKRAKEIFDDIFRAYARGDKTYIMPW